MPVARHRGCRAHSRLVRSVLRGSLGKASFLRAFLTLWGLDLTIQGTVVLDLGSPARRVVDSLRPMPTVFEDREEDPGTRRPQVRNLPPVACRHRRRFPPSFRIDDCPIGKDAGSPVGHLFGHEEHWSSWMFSDLPWYVQVGTILRQSQPGFLI